MDKFERAVFIMSQSVCAIAEIEGMKADNEVRRVDGGLPIFLSTDFERVIEKYKLGPHDILKFINDEEVVCLNS